MNIAVIFAGGVGIRMRTNGIPKQFLEINGVPILVHTVRKFQESPSIDKIVIAMVASHIDYTWQLVDKYHLDKVVKVVAGGETGQLSIYNGLKAAEEVGESPEDIVLIHDGVRPIIDDDLIRKNVESVRQYGSAISSVLCKETIITVRDDDFVDTVTDRSKTWMARAPQSFYLKDILAAHEECRSQGIINKIDSCNMMRDCGREVHIVETSSTNIKVTNPEDYYLAEAIIQMSTGEKERV
ncbi:MAG: 2-C-methyl-D-erythritol 4-phosphate cytidylyltransferase [Erysipelotrichaceae bacterium]|nr:2-C-methyl-D-erythritol 4-phosphate cytidylyltransferase [Erysipelotrichaceae bacterium]